MLQALLIEDPARAFSEPHYSYLGTVVRDWALQDFAAAELRVKEATRSQRIYAVAVLLNPSAWGDASGMNFSTQPRDRPPQDAAQYLTAVVVPILAMAQQDPQQALDALEQIPYLHTKTKLSPLIAEEWAKTDPAAALTWSQTLPGKHVRDWSKARIEHVTTGNWPSGF